MAEKQHREPEPAPQATAGGQPVTPAFLAERVYVQLRQLAGGYLQNERMNHTLQPTALVHEAYLRLAQQDNIAWRNEGQFYVLAARAMRHILIDHARGKKRLKRGEGWIRMQLEQLPQQEDTTAGVDLIALDDALHQLAELDVAKAQLVELRFFAGMSLEDAADALGIARSTASAHWRMARAWLHQRIDGDQA